jgi:phospholipid/cholesterol/gamma-HCH transport system substrate-binding protein
MAVRNLPVKTMFKVLVFALVSAIFTAALAVKIGNLQLFTHNYGLSAQFANAGGVFRGDDVKLAGVDVGRVSRTLIQNGKGVVEFSVDDKVKLTTDSIVAIRWRNVLGQRFLYLYPGDGKGRVLKAGDVIPVDHTQDAADIGQFLNELGPILRAIDPDKANAFLDAVNTALSGNEAAVQGLIDNGAVLASQLGSMDKEIQGLLTSSNTVIGIYANQHTALSGILDNLNVLAQRLQQSTGDINSVVTNFADVQQQLDKLIRGNRSNIDTDLKDLQSVAQTLQANKSNLEQTLCTVPAGVAGYFQTTSWGEWFNVRITEISLQTSNDQTILRQKELPNQHPSKSQQPYTACGTYGYHGPAAPGSGPSNGTGGGTGPGGNPLPPIPTGGGPQGLGGLVQFVLGTTKAPAGGASHA